MVCLLQDLRLTTSLVLLRVPCSAAAKQALSGKRKTAVKSFAKAKPQPSNTKNTKARQAKDAGKKKACSQMLEASC